jgi:hypothetical protein
VEKEGGAGGSRIGSLIGGNNLLITIGWEVLAKMGKY